MREFYQLIGEHPYITVGLGYFLYIVVETICQAWRDKKG